MRNDFEHLWLVYIDNVSGLEVRLPAIDWIGQPGPIDANGDELELIGFEVGL